LGNNAIHGVVKDWAIYQAGKIRQMTDFGGFYVVENLTNNIFGLTGFDEPCPA
jgi:hypothetical protein